MRVWSPQDEKNGMTCYERQVMEFERGRKEVLEEFEEEKRQVLDARESLWKAAGVCMSCGTAYQGQP